MKGKKYTIEIRSGFEAGRWRSVDLGGVPGGEHLGNQFGQMEISEAERSASWATKAQNASRPPPNALLLRLLSLRAPYSADGQTKTNNITNN